MISVRSSRLVIGWTVLLSHFIAIGLIFYYGSNRFGENTISEVMQGVLSVAPVTAIYVVAFVRYSTIRREELTDEYEQEFYISSFAVQYFVIALFSGSLVAGIIILFETGILRFQDIPIFTGGLDTIFGAYLAVIFHRLFPAKVFSGEQDQVTKASDKAKL